MKIKLFIFQLCIVLVVLALLLIPVVALASDISSAIYSGVITISNNGTAITNGVAVLMLNSQSLIDVYGVDTAFDYTAVRNSSGADVPYGPSVNSTYPWCFFLSSLGDYTSTNYILYTGNSSMNATRSYFPGSGGMSVTDNGSLEWGSSGNLTISGFFNPTSTGYLFNKPDALTIQGNGSGNLTSTAYNALSPTTSAAHSPNANGSVIELTPIGGANWQCVSDANDGTLVTNTVSPYKRDLYTYAAHTENGTINWVAIYFRIAGSGGISKAKPTWQIGGVSYNGTEVFVPGVPTTYSQNWTNSPATGVVWSWAELDSSEIGIWLDANTGGGGAASNCYELYFVVGYTPYGTSVINTSVITAEEHVFQAYLSGGTLGFKVDDEAAITTSFSGNVTNNSNNITISSGDILYYVEYAQILQSGVETGHWEWEYAATFSDQSGNGNTLTPSFRTTSSDSDVTVTLASFSPLSTAIAPAFSISTALPFYIANITASSNFTSSSVSVPGGGPPGVGLIEDVAEASDTPLPWIWGILAMTTIGISSFGVDYMQKRYGFRSLWPKIFIGVLVIGLLITFGKFDWWMMVMYGFIVLALAIASRHTDVGGSVSQHGLIGFLAQSWIGLTIINRIIEGQLITSAEQTWSNYYAFTQEFRLFDIFSLPVINLDFFTHGIPSLIKWDYSFFGGNAQMIQYLLYSITAVVAFIIFLAIVPLVYNFFKSIL